MLSQFDLHDLNIERPEKILWEFKSRGNLLLDSIPSSSLRSFFAKSAQLLDSSNISYSFRDIDAVEYSKWLQYYESKMIENGFSIMANEEWFKEVQRVGKKVKMLLFEMSGNWLATGIVLIDEDKNSNLAFKASDKVDLSNHKNSSIGSLVDYYFLLESMKNGYAAIYSGKSRNAFGVINNVGYLDFKLKNGYAPTLPADVNMLNEVPLNETGEVLFFGKKSNELVLYYVHPIKTVTLSTSSIESYYKQPIINLTY